MWSYRIIAPYLMERTSIADKTPDDLADGQVLLRFLAAGVCGSDMPAFRGAKGRLPGDDGVSAAEKDGFPIHEIAGEVIASRHPEHRPGDRVVGWASGFDGLMERVISDGNGLAPVRSGVDSGARPSACSRWRVCCTPASNCPIWPVVHVAIIGQGSIGLLFSYVAKAAGARRVTGVDPVDRRSLATAFGVDDAVRATSDRWVSQLAAADRADIVIEAVGHQVATLGHAIEAAAFGGTVLYFGVADDEAYPISMRLMLRNNLTLKSGVTLDRRRVLELAGKFAAEHPELLSARISRTPSGSTTRRPRSTWPAGRTPSASRSRSPSGAAFAATCSGRWTKPIWGGWITGPTLIGPEEFARAGYDYVGFDAQHGYLDDADVAGILRRLEHVPIATAVRLPNADAAPIGRVLDAGADAVIIAMIESAEEAAAAVAATRYPPAGVRSFGPLRASLGYDSAALESRVSVFAMIETAAALDNLTRSVPWTA